MNVIKLKLDRDNRTLVMPDDFYFREPDSEPLTVLARSTDLGGPMAILSAAPAGRVWRGAPVLGAAAAQGLILVALFGGIRIPSAPIEPATIEMIQVPPVPQAEPPTERPPKPVAEAPEPEIPLKPADPPPSMAALSEQAPEMPSLPPRLDPVPEAQSVTQQEPVPQEAPLPGPSSAAPEAATPSPPATSPTTQSKPAVIPPLPRVVRRVPPKPVRPPLLAESRPALTEVAAPPVRTEAVATAAPASAASESSARAEPRAEDALRGRIRDAVQAAVRCPPAAQMMGRSGKAGVAFDYRDGVIRGDVRLTRSTGTPMLDAAALTAVRDAHYPKAPSEMADQVLRLLIWVDEACGG